MFLLLFVINLPYEKNNARAECMIIAHTHPINSKYVFLNQNLILDVEVFINETKKFNIVIFKDIVF